VCFAVLGDEELLLIFGRVQLMAELVNLLVERNKFGLEMLLLLLEDFSMLLLSLAGCEPMVKVNISHQRGSQI
jgi:hypothetical protein